jgi:hypothetical protein
MSIATALDDTLLLAPLDGGDDVLPNNLAHQLDSELPMSTI